MSLKGVFRSSSWFEAWGEAFGEAWVAIGPNLSLPLSMEIAPLGVFSIRVLRGPANDHSPWLDLPRPMREARVVWVNEVLSSHQADLLVLPLLRLSRDVAAAFPSGPFCRWECAESAPFVDCTQSWETYWGSRGKKTRAEWGRSERRLKELGFGLVCHSEEAGLEDALDEAFAIEGDGWKGEGGSAILQDANLERFYRQVARNWAAQGALRLYFLEDGSQRIAFQLCALDQGQVVSLKIGFRQEFSRLGPGQALQLMILRKLFAEEGVARFDLLGPATEHKLRWATDAEQLWTVRCFRRGVRGLLAALRWSYLPELRSRASAWGLIS